MGSAKYGLATAMQDVVGGYEKEQQRQAAGEQAGQKSQMDEMKIQEQRGKLQKEGFADSVRLILAGDMSGAMEKYNAMGDDRMSELEYDPDDGMVSFLDNEGTQRDMMIGQLMLSAGMNPKDLDTPEAELGREKELVTHKAQEAKKYGIGKSGSKPTAYIQNLEYTMKTLTGGDPDKAFKLMQLSKSDPQTAYSRILVGLQKQNQEAFGEEKMTDEEMRKKAKDSVTSFRDDMFKGLLGEQAPAADNKDPLGWFNK